MARALRIVAAIVGCIAASGMAFAQKSGGILREYQIDSPASMSIHEEATVLAERTVMPVFSNLVIFDQHIAQNSLSSIRPELATDWVWDEDGSKLTFHLRKGVKWHDGKPFTAADVKCTWDLLQGKAADKLRVNPRKAWYNNLDEVTTNGDYEATFNLKRPQPALLALLASGLSPVYPCHVAAGADAPAPDRHRPVQIRRVQAQRVDQGDAQNPDYWKPGLPYLDGIEYTIVRNRSTIILAFIAGKYDLTFAGSVTVPLMHDIEKPAARGDLRAAGRAASAPT